MKEMVDRQPKASFEDGLINYHAPKPQITNALTATRNYQAYVICDPKIHSKFYKVAKFYLKMIIRCSQ